MRGLVNMSIFLLLANYLAALFGIQLFRSDVPATFNMNFQGIVTSFLAMYQVFTSENWTDVLWATGNAESLFKQQVIAILFMVIWFFFANCKLQVQFVCYLLTTSCRQSSCYKCLLP
jgi:voltage-dependent calcium channel